MSEDTDNTDDEEHRDLADYHCMAHVETMPSPEYGEVSHAYFDAGVLGEWVYRELLDVIREDGYELLAFGTATEEDATTFEDVEPGAHKAVFVYRG